MFILTFFPVSIDRFYMLFIQFVRKCISSFIYLLCIVFVLFSLVKF